MRNDIPEGLMRLAAKIDLNSYYPPYANNYFFMFDDKLAQKITNDGRELLNKTKNRFK